MLSYAPTMGNVLTGLHRSLQLVTCPATGNGVVRRVASRRVKPVYAVVSKGRSVLAHLKAVGCTIAAVVARLTDEGCELIAGQLECKVANLCVVAVAPVQVAEVITWTFHELRFVGALKALYLRAPLERANGYMFEVPTIATAQPVDSAASAYVWRNRARKGDHGVGTEALSGQVFHSRFLALTRKLSGKAATTKRLATLHPTTANDGGLATIAKAVPVTVLLRAKERYGLYQQAPKSLARKFIRRSTPMTLFHITSLSQITTAVKFAAKGR
jgi:hypothetical protein